MSRIPEAMEIYRHFKGNLYQIIGIATHSETREQLVVYRAMYGDLGMYVRPLAMFMEPTDKVKYPEATQEYRFEPYDTLTGTTKRPRWADDVPAVAQATVAATEQKEAPAVAQTTVAVIEQKGAPAVAQATATAAPEGEAALDPQLVQFLDADTYEDRLSILALLHGRITDEMINTMAVACDLEIKDGDLESRYAELKNCLITMEKFECNRLR